MSCFDASRMLSFDLETTSANPTDARIVTSALITIDGSSTETTHLLADPGVEIPQAAAEIHGITTEKARAEGRPHDEVLQETIDKIRQGWQKGFTLIVFNAPYDLTVLRTLSGGEFTVDGPVYDPYVIDRAKDPYRKGRRNLGALSEYYRVGLENAHDASADALAAARIAWKQVNQHWKEIKELEEAELMEYQAVSFYDAQMGLKEYFEKSGRSAANVQTSWPMQG